ncbi:MAG: general secretion pathway protein GspB [Desulfobacterales bacterium]
MSSILKALKKLEGEPVIGTEVQSWPRAVGKGAYFDRFRRTWRYKGTAYILLVTGTLAMAGWFVMGRNPVPDTSDSPQRSASVQPVSPDDPEVLISAKEPKAELSRRSLGKPIPIRSDTKKPMLSATVPGLDPKPRPVSEENVPPTPLPDEEASLETAPLPSVPPESKDAPREPVAPFVAERADDGRMSLQAIAWSRLPEKRMAVINNRVVREGGTVNGIEVIRIHEDRVIIREGEEVWKLVFKLR